jgi:hypothetical protein
VPRPEKIKFRLGSVDDGRVRNRNSYDIVEKEEGPPCGVECEGRWITHDLGAM